MGVVRRSENLAAVGAAGEDARRTAAGTAALLLQGVLFRRGLLAAPFLFMDEKNDNSGMEREKEMIDLQAVADENPKRKGEMIEAAFLAKVCKLRIPVCKPWGDSERYDFVVDWGKGFWSVQVKGGTSHKRSGYKVESGRDGRVFTKDDKMCIRDSLQAGPAPTPE